MRTAIAVSSGPVSAAGPRPAGSPRVASRATSWRAQSTTNPVPTAGADSTTVMVWTHPFDACSDAEMLTGPNSPAIVRLAASTG